MKNYNLPKILNYCFVIIALIGLIYLMLLYTSKYSLGLIYNSDIVSIPYLYTDLFKHHGSLSQWIFPPTTCFFPDILAYFLLVGIFQNQSLAIMLFGVCQFLAYFSLIVLVGKKSVQSNSFPSIFILAALLTFFLYASGTLQQNAFYAPIFGGHFGAALMLLLGLWLILHSFSHKGIFNYIALGLICVLTVFSDVLFITQFVITALITLIILAYLAKIPKKIYWINTCVIGFSSLIGYLFFAKSKLFGIHMVHDHPLIKRYHLHDLIAATKMIIAKLTIFYQDNAIIVLACFLFFVITLVYLSHIIYHRLHGKLVKKEDLPFVFTITLIFISIIVGYFSLIFLDNNIVSNDPSLRHFQPFILFPVFLGLPLYLAKFTNIERFLTKYFKTIIVAMLICGFIFAPKASIRPLVNYYPAYVACLDQYATQYNLKNGIGQYWDGKLISVLSKKDLNVVAVTINKGKIVPYIWDNTLNAYLNKDFNFVIIDNPQNDDLNITQVTKAYGKPEKILQCPMAPAQPQILIYIYPNGLINSTWNKNELKL